MQSEHRSCPDNPQYRCQSVDIVPLDITEPGFFTAKTSNRQAEALSGSDCLPSVPGPVTANEAMRDMLLELKRVLVKVKESSDEKLFASQQWRNIARLATLILDTIRCEHDMPEVDLQRFDCLTKAGLAPLIHHLEQVIESTENEGNEAVSRRFFDDGELQPKAFINYLHQESKGIIQYAQLRCLSNKVKG